jgi:hypothetical protein
METSCQNKGLHLGEHHHEDNNEEDNNEEEIMVMIGQNDQKIKYFLSLVFR